MLQIITTINHICFSLRAKQGFPLNLLRVSSDKIKCLDGKLAERDAGRGNIIYSALR